MNEMTYNIHSVAENVWAIQEGKMVSSYLIVGTEKALLVDAGGALHEMRKKVEEITSLPVTLALTHGHPDHTLCLNQFEEAWVDPADFDLIKGTGMDLSSTKLIPLEAGHIFDLGGRKVETIALRGHTMGGMAYLDRANGLLFSGDTINLGPIFMFLPECSIDMLIAELEKFDAMEGFTQIFPAHNIHPVGREKIKDILACAKAVKSGELEGITPPAGMPPMPPTVKLYMKDGCGMLY